MTPSLNQHRHPLSEKLSRASPSSSTSRVKPLLLRTASFMSSPPGSLRPSRGRRAQRGRSVDVRSHPACTHTTMTRLYGDWKCHICERVPALGYVYRCIQDSSLLQARGLDLDEVTKRLNTGKSGNTAEVGIEDLSPWIIKAIKAGHYTPDQIEILKTQRARVKECIAEDEAPELASPEYSIQTLKDLIGFSTKTGDTPSSESQLHDSDNSEPDSSDPQSIGPETPPGPPPSPASMSTPRTSLEAPRLHPECRLRVCPNCRPSYIDRSWHRLDAVVNGDFEPTLQWELDCRPISSAHLLRDIALRRPTEPVGWADAESEDLKAMDNIEIVSSHDDGFPVSNGDGYVEEVQYKGRGFRSGLKRAITDLVHTARRHSWYSAKSNAFGSYSEPALPNFDDEDGEDTSTLKRMNEEVLETATHTTLPESYETDVEEEYMDEEAEGEDAEEDDGGVTIANAETPKEYLSDLITQA